MAILNDNLFSRTKWKRQTTVGLELLAEAGNFAAVQRIIQTNPYWTYHPEARVVISNMDAILKQQQTLNMCRNNQFLQQILATNNGIDKINFLSPNNFNSQNLPASSIGSSEGGKLSPTVSDSTQAISSSNNLHTMSKLVQFSSSNLQPDPKLFSAFHRLLNVSKPVV